MDNIQISIKKILYIYIYINFLLGPEILEALTIEKKQTWQSA